MSDSKISYSIPEFCEASGLCRSNVYEAIREGRLTARKHGRRTIIVANEAKAFIAALPQVLRTVTVADETHRATPSR